MSDGKVKIKVQSAVGGQEFKGLRVKREIPPVFLGGVLFESSWSVKPQGLVHRILAKTLALPISIKRIDSQK